VLAAGAGLTMAPAAEITHVDGYAIDCDVRCGANSAGGCLKITPR